MSNRKIIYNVINNTVEYLKLQFVDFINDEDLKTLLNAIKLNNSIKGIIIDSPDIVNYIPYNRFNYQEGIIEDYYNKFNSFIITIFDIIKSKNITSLNLSNVTKNNYDKRIHNIVFSNLYALLENNNSLLNLDLSKNKLKNNIKDLLNIISKNANLKLENINLSYTSLYDIDLIINFLMQNRTIKKIDLSNNQITKITNLDKVIKNNNIIEEINLSCNKITDTFLKNKNELISSCNNYNNLNISVYDLLNSKLSNDDNKFEKSEIENIVSSIINSGENYDQNLFKNIIINTINNSNIKKIDLSFNDINYIKPFYKHNYKIKNYKKLSKTNSYYKNELKNYLQKHFNIDTLNDDFLKRLKKLNSEIILLWGNPGLIGGSI